jgi:hypothetical protein
MLRTLRSPDFALQEQVRTSRLVIVVLATVAPQTGALNIVAANVVRGLAKFLEKRDAYE